MFELLFFAAVLIVLIVLSILLLNLFGSDDHPKQMRSININEDHPEINTGDIFIVGYRNLNGYFISALTKSLWAHSALAVRDKNNVLWILESTIRNDGKPPLCFVPFNSWLNMNKKHYIAYIKYEGPQISTDIVKKAYEHHRNIKLDYFGPNWERFLYKRSYKSRIDREFTCNETMIIILQAMNIIKKDYDCSSYLPYDIPHLNFNIENGIKYHPMIGIKVVT